MKVEILTEGYQFAHRHAPRGRGSWAFAEDYTAPGDSPDIFWTPGSTTFTEAKRLAKKHFAGKARSVHVLP